LKRSAVRLEVAFVIEELRSALEKQAPDPKTCSLFEATASESV
jgi:hypothetical protein